MLEKYNYPANIGKNVNVIKADEETLLGAISNPVSRFIITPSGEFGVGVLDVAFVGESKEAVLKIAKRLYTVSVGCGINLSDIMVQGTKAVELHRLWYTVSDDHKERLRKLWVADHCLDRTGVLDGGMAIRLSRITGLDLPALLKDTPVCPVAT